jgi:hypothetical protein
MEVLQAEKLISAACARACLFNFGRNGWQEGLEVLLRSAAKEAALSRQGEAVWADTIIKLLCNRLEVEDWYSRYPEIEEQEIVAPIFGVGLPRTGSTALANLLALDPARRYLRTWEAEQPCPPPSTSTEHTDPRIAKAEERIAATRQMFPDFAGMLPVSATGPQECIYNLALEFRSRLFGSLGRIPTYIDWMLSCDMEPAYRYHRRVLKLLQWQCPPRRWFLKSPSHMASISALQRVFPDARFVMTHRDISKSVPSSAALILALSGPLTDEPDPIYQGRQQSYFYEISLQRLIAFRQAGNENRFFDIGFGEFQADPIEQIRALYESLGEALSAGAERRMRSWWVDNRMKREPSSYTAKNFGIELEDLGERFQFYSDRFAPFMKG